MSKPPASTPHSDIDGVHRDERRNTDVAEELDQAGGDLARAKDESVARPRSLDEEGRDDRSQ